MSQMLSLMSLVTRTILSLSLTLPIPVPRSLALLTSHPTTAQGQAYIYGSKPTYIYNNSAPAPQHHNPPHPTSPTTPNHSFSFPVVPSKPRHVHAHVHVHVHAHVHVHDYIKPRGHVLSRCIRRLPSQPLPLTARHHDMAQRGFFFCCLVTSIEPFSRPLTQPLCAQPRDHLERRGP